MTPIELRALQAQILADARCAPFVVTNDMPKVSGGEAYERDSAIAGIVNQGRTRLHSRIVSERGVRACLPIPKGAQFIRALRDISEASEAPDWLDPVLDALQVAPEDRWAYLDTLQCAYPWLRTDGLDLGALATQGMLDLIAVGQPVLASACATLKALGREPDPVTPDVVSRALRGPWGDE